MIKLKEAAYYVSDKIDVSKLTRNQYITTDNMLPNRGGVTDCENLPQSARVTKYECGDILVSNIRPYFKKIWYANKVGGCSNDVIVFRANNDSLNSKFLYYVLSQNSFFDFVMSGANGTKMPRGNKDLIPDFLMPNFNTKKQKSIADILSAYDDLIENNRKQIKLLEEVAQRLYKEWFVDFRFPGYENAKFIDDIPEGWRNGILGDIAENTGKSEKKQNRNKYNCYLPIDCLPKKSLVCIDSSDINSAESSLFAFKPYDILFGAMRPYFHKVVIAQDIGLTRSTCFILNSKEKNYWSFLAMLLFAEDTINYATGISVGTTMPYVRWKDFAQMPILIPSEPVCADFNRHFMHISNKISNLAKQNNKLTQARDRLLPKLMSGEIEP